MISAEKLVDSAPFGLACYRIVRDSHHTMKGFELHKINPSFKSIFSFENESNALYKELKLSNAIGFFEETNESASFSQLIFSEATNAWYYLDFWIAESEWLMISVKEKVETRISEEIFEKLSTQFAHLSGKDFFEAISAQISLVLGIDYVFVGKLNYNEHSVTVLGGYAKGAVMGDLTYDLEGTPCNNVMGKELCIYPDGVQYVFPKDILLQEMGVNAYLGSPIMSKEGDPLGIIVALNEEPFSTTNQIKRIINLFIERITAEMQRFKSEQSFQQSQLRLKSIINTMAEGLVMHISTGEIVFANQNAEKILGLTNNQLLGKSPIDSTRKIIHEDGSDFPVHQNPAMITLKTGIPQRNVLMGVRKNDGQLIWISVNSQPVFTENETIPNAVVATFNDVTETNKITTHYKTILQNSIDGFLIHDLNGKIIEVNDAFCRLLNYSKEELLTLSVADIEANETEEDVMHHLAKLIEFKSDRFETQHRRKDGKKIDIEVSAKYVDLGYEYIAIFVRDITERKQYEAALKVSEEKYRNLFNTMPNGYYQSVPEGKFINANPAFIEMLGYKNLDELKQVDIKKTLYVQPDERDDILTHNAEFINQEENYRLLRKDGTTIWVEDNARYVKDEEGNVLYHEGICRDISDRIKFEMELRKRNSELDRFVYSASHDLRAPLSSLLGLINLADTMTNDKESEFIQIYQMMEKSVKKLDDFISEILDYSRNHHLPIVSEEINFEEEINQIIKSLDYLNKGTTWKLSISIIGNSVIKSDKKRLKIILNNLISNAIKYLNGSKPTSEISITIEQNPNEAIIYVKDNGIGIKQEYLTKIFEMFFRATEKSTGSGLGLYIAKETVERLHGSICVNSTFGEGSIFTVRIPNQNH
ncbi:MAG: PAS domain S-box protein [Bacteroidetes bacterium]|nr:PAS domain S-box protein [Bacteroidota bacterium]NCQ10751.1 PAS domain S-box protein [Bacteroidota bacterium]